MNEQVSLVITIVGALFTWTSTVVGLVVWLTGKFRDLEQLIYRENKKLEDVVDEHNMKIQRLEIKSFGFTPARLSEPPP